MPDYGFSCIRFSGFPNLLLNHIRYRYHPPLITKLRYYLLAEYSHTVPRITIKQFYQTTGNAFHIRNAVTIFKRLHAIPFFLAGTNKILSSKFSVYIRYSFMLCSTLSYSIPANVFNIASNIIFAPLAGTAIPICFLTDSFEPSKI